jgi:hypothetical protein
MQLAGKILEPMRAHAVRQRLPGFRLGVREQILRGHALSLWADNKNLFLTAKTQSAQRKASNLID